MEKLVQTNSTILVVLDVCLHLKMVHLLATKWCPKNMEEVLLAILLIKYLGSTTQYAIPSQKSTIHFVRSRVWITPTPS